MTRVLVVDDSATAREVVRRALVASGVPNSNIREACNGRVALAKIAEQPPQLVLSDINMPEMDGFELLSEMNRLGYVQSIPVVMITSRSCRRDRDRVLSLGAQAMIRKPFPVYALKTYIEPYLDIGTRSEPEVFPSQEGSTTASVSDALDTSVTTTLRMFVSSSPDSCPLPSSFAGKALYYAALQVTKGHHGVLWVAATSDAIAAFMKAGQGSSHANQVAWSADALAELVNALAGEFCESLVGPGEYAFDIPTCDILPGASELLRQGQVYRVVADSEEHHLVCGYTSEVSLLNRKAKAG
jgi:CheY-like chemotaxis protein